MENQETAVQPETTPATVNVSPDPKAFLASARKKKASDRTPEEVKAIREYNKTAQKKTTAKKKTTSYVYDSNVEVTKPEAKRILEERGLKHPHVIDTVYKLLLRASEEHQIPANRFLFQNGIAQTLASIEAGEAKPLEPIASDVVPGELITRVELHSLFDAGIATVEPITFAQYLETRLRCKKDCWFLGKEILDKDFAECHRNWADFFPKLDPTTLRPGYTQKEAIKWLSSQSPDISTYMLLASRSAFKSSFNHVWILSAILCQPSIRILLCSETRPLAKDFIGVIRGYFETTPGQESRFHRYFSEYTIPAGDGSVLSLECPMAHLKLAQSITSTSFDSSVAGNRCDVLVSDDGISSTSCGNDVQIQASINKFLALGKLVEVGGLKLVLGTPWQHNDMYSYIMSMAEAPDSGISVRVDPAFVVKREAQHKLTTGLLFTLREDEIESFLFPERLNWKFLRREIGTTQESASFFLSQNLCIFPRDLDSGLRVTFELEDLEIHTKGVGFFDTPTYTKFLVVDRAWSVSKFADYSCLNVSTIQKVKEKTAMVVRDVRLERLKESELVKAICDMIQKHHDVRYLIMERDKGWETLGTAILTQLQYRSLRPPQFVWRDIKAGALNDRAKAKRMKKLEGPLQSGLLWFCVGDWNAVAFKQMTDFNGIQKSNSTRKDDFCDTCGLGWEVMGPKELDTEAPQPKTAEQKREEEEMYRQAVMREHHQRVHGGFYGGTRTQPGTSPQGGRASDYDPTRNNRPPEPEPQRPLNPREAQMAQLMKILPPGMRRRG